MLSQAGVSIPTQVRYLTCEQGAVIDHQLVFPPSSSYSCLPSHYLFAHAVGDLLRFLRSLLTSRNSPLCGPEITRTCRGPRPHLCSTFVRRCHLHPTNRAQKGKYRFFSNSEGLVRRQATYQPFFNFTANVILVKRAQYPIRPS